MSEKSHSANWRSGLGQSADTIKSSGRATPPYSSAGAQLLPEPF